jgi:hypothetical protein
MSCLSRLHNRHVIPLMHACRRYYGGQITKVVNEYQNREAQWLFRFQLYKSFHDSLDFVQLWQYCAQYQFKTIIFIIVIGLPSSKSGHAEPRLCSSEHEKGCKFAKLSKLKYNTGTISSKNALGWTIWWKPLWSDRADSFKVRSCKSSDYAAFENLRFHEFANFFHTWDPFHQYATKEIQIRKGRSVNTLPPSGPRRNCQLQVCN